MARSSKRGSRGTVAAMRKASPAKGRTAAKAKRALSPSLIQAKRAVAPNVSKGLNEAREQQAATAEILKVIARSPSDVQPVFEVIVENAVRLCQAHMGRVPLRRQCHPDGGGVRPERLGKVQQVFPRPATEDTIAGQVMQSRQCDQSVACLQPRRDPAAVFDPPVVHGQALRLARAAPWVENM